MLIGYARVSRDKQETALQLDALDKAGCQRVYVEKLSGASPERPELERCLDTLRGGDTLIVWHLDRLGRSIKDLIEIVSSLKRQGIGFRSLTQSDIDTTTANGALVFHVFAPWLNTNAHDCKSAHGQGWRLQGQEGDAVGDPWPCQMKTPGRQGPCCRM